MISLILKIVLISIVAAYAVKLFGSSRRTVSPSESNDGRKRFKTKGLVIKDADFSEIKDASGKNQS